MPLPPVESLPHVTIVRAKKRRPIQGQISEAMWVFDGRLELAEGKRQAIWLEMEASNCGVCDVEFTDPDYDWGVDVMPRLPLREAPPAEYDPHDEK